MSEYKFPAAVSQLIEKQLATGRYSSEDEILEAALQRLDEESDDWAAIKEAIDSLDAGEPGLSLTEAFEEVRRRNKIAG
ncbi:MAG: type II toxin-antitoxin system ParD family antitoxin [Planctomycetaceae bacterium]